MVLSKICTLPKTLCASFSKDSKKSGMPKLRRLSSLILRLIPSIGPFEYLANLGLAAFKTWAKFLSVVKVFKA